MAGEDNRFFFLSLHNSFTRPWAIKLKTIISTLELLILTRKVTEKLKVGDEVTMTIVGISGNQVRIGINAPRDVEVHRQEIYEKILLERGEAKE